MAHYAFLDENNIVVEVIVGVDETVDGKNWEQIYQTYKNKPCRRTSCNTKGGIHYSANKQPSTDQSKSFRKNFAGIGYTYDENRDAFIPPKPYNSWVLDENSCLWQAPIAYPSDGQQYVWNEILQLWEILT